MEDIIHLPEFRVIICSKCQYAILPTQIYNHFKAFPHNFTIKARQRVIHTINRITGLIQDLDQLKQCVFPWPIDTSQPVAALAVPRTSGLRCTFNINGSECPYISSCTRKMRKHCWEEHQWKSENKGGRPRKDSINQSQEVPWRSGVQYQQFFKQGAKSQFFEVGRNGQRAVAIPVKSTWDKLKEKMDAGFAEVEEMSRRKIEATDESKEPNPWLRRTGFAKHLSGLDRQVLQALVRPIDGKDDPALEVIHTAFDHMIQAAQKIAVTNVIGQAALFEAHRKEINKKPNKPFNSRMDKTTFKSYTRHWKQLLSYMWRVDKLPAYQQPKFKITHRQGLAFDELAVLAKTLASQPEGHPATAEQKKVEGCLLRLCIALLDHELGDNQYQSIIISGLAVLGLQEGGRWANPEDYTTKLSGVIKLARLMVVQKAFDLRQYSIMRRKYHGMSQDEAEEAAPSHVQLIQRMNIKFMTLMGSTGKPSPMDWMLDTRTYGMHITYSTPAEGSVSWRGDTILYQQIQLSMSQIRSMVHGLVAETRRVLIQDLLLLQLDEHGDIQGQPLPPIDWANTVDNPTEQKIGWSFLQDIRNQFDVTIPSRDWLAQRVVEDPVLKNQFLHEEQSQIQWRTGAVQIYQRKIEQFQERLLILMHLAGGQAARAPEIISIRHRNTSNGGVRNIFIDQGLVLFVTAYHKGYEFSEKAKLIQRYLPKEVGELLVYYLWLALPFWEALQVASGVEELSAFIWGDGSNEEKADLDQEEHDEAQGEPNSQVSFQAGPGNSKVSSKPWTSERMRKIIQRESTAWMGVRLNISAWRQVSIAIARKFLRDSVGFEDSTSPQGFENFDEDNPEGDSPWDLQSGHGTRMAGMIYARLLSEGSFETQTQKRRFQLVSQEWHQFLGFPSSQLGFGLQIGQKRRRLHWQEVNQEMQQLRQRQLSQVNLHTQLEMLLGAGQQFRGQQKPAIHAIMQGHSPILVIMGTGGGKSLLFMLPARCASGGTTIVIVPLVALQGDLQERCQQAQISSLVWKSQRPYDQASLIFVTPESAVSKTFAGFLNRLQEMHQLDRIVVDECHTILDGSSSFRPKLQQLGELVLRGVQMVYLTATLPPRDEEQFCQLMHIHPKELQLFRDRTSRKNVAYQVHQVEVEEGDIFGRPIEEAGFPMALQEAVTQLVQDKLQQYPRPAKIIIYSSVIRGAEALGDVLGCEVYHRDIDSQNGKARRLKQWRHAHDDGGMCQGRVIIATNALGLGVDVPDIRVVIHIGKIWTLKDYAQESGRAGRDGQPSEAIILHSTGVGGDRYDTHGPVDIGHFIQGQICRRVVLDEVMDAPRSRAGCEDREEACDLCQRGCAVEEAFEDSGFLSQGCDIRSSPFRASQSSPPAYGKDIRSQTREQIYQHSWTRSRVLTQRCYEGTEIKAFQDQLDEWVGQCPLCHLIGGSEDPYHRLQDCAHQDSRDIYLYSKQLQQDMEDLRAYQAFSCCTWCGVPQAICDKWQQKEVGWWEEVPGGQCQYSGVLIPSIISMLLAGSEVGSDLVSQWFLKHQVDAQDSKAVCRWFGRRRLWGGIEATQMAFIFYQLCQVNHRGI